MKREETQQFNAGPYVSYIWSIADDWLRDVYVPSDYRKVILPMVVLRRRDLVLEPTKAKVLEMKRAGAEYLIIGNCSDCSNTVVTCGTLKMGLKVIHQTDHVMRTIHHPLYRHLTISKTVDQDLSEF